MRERFRTVIPVSNSDGEMHNVGLNVPLPMTEVEWERFHAILEVMKPALVEPTRLDASNG